MSRWIAAHDTIVPLDNVVEMRFRHPMPDEGTGVVMTIFTDSNLIRYVSAPTKIETIEEAKRCLALCLGFAPMVTIIPSEWTSADDLLEAITNHFDKRRPT